MKQIKTFSIAGLMAFALVLSGCGGSGGSTSSGETETKSFTVALTNIEVARTSDGTPVNIEVTDVSTSGSVKLKK